MARVLALGLSSLLLIALLLSGCGAREKTPLSVFIAGSLMIPFAALEAAYEAARPEVDAQMEAHGSIQVIRHVTDIHQKIDVVVTADHDLIPMLMYETNDPQTGLPYADWYAQFATNEMALAYTDRSRFAAEVDAENWHEVIARPGVTVGISDPRFDPAGYRALMVLKLAEPHYGDPKIYQNVISGRFRTPIRVYEEHGRTIVRVPEIVDPRPNSGVIVRGSSIGLIALLQTGDLDYAFEYESVIRQHGFHMVPFPPTVNLGLEERDPDYARVSVVLDFRRFASVTPEFTGATIGYGVTIPSNAPQPELARDFVAYLLGPEGQRIMAENHHPCIVPARGHNREAMPEALRALTVEWLRPSDRP